MTSTKRKPGVAKARKHPQRSSHFTPHLLRRREYLIETEKLKDLDYEFGDEPSDYELDKTAAEWLRRIK